MKLPLVNVLSEPYEVWSERKPTKEEMFSGGSPVFAVKDKLIKKVCNAKEAAVHVLTDGVGNGLENFIEDSLNNSSKYKDMKKAMPSKTPDGLAEYQKKYPQYDAEKVSKEINEIGMSLAEGQCLFHAGAWPEEFKEKITDRPLSTSLCPQVARQNALHKGKAYNAGRIDILILKAVEPKTNVFVFKDKGTNLGHEKEILFAAGAKVTFKKRTKVRDDYIVGAYISGNMEEKKIPVYVVEVEVS